MIPQQPRILRQDIEQRESEMLAPYAALSAESKGRVYPTAPHPMRTSYQRDRDRIIHCTAFRRMAYKTQVFIPHEQDHFRTRLTHTIEVAQISRTLARSLRLNEDLAEAIALVHDLGHTPFGHSGEDVLNELLAGQGGFNHNLQSLRIVDFLEQRYPEYDGLNLSYEVREGIVKHETSMKIELPEFEGYHHPTLEASLVDIADEVTYNSHDIDDGLVSGLLTWDELLRAEFWQRLPLSQDSDFRALPEDKRRYALVRHLLDFVTTDLIETTRSRLESFGINSLEAVRSHPEPIAAYSEEIETTVALLKEFLYDRLYRHPNLRRMSEHAWKVVETLWRRYTADPSLLPDKFKVRLNEQNRVQVVTDYIAGMTDRFALNTYDRLK